MKANAATYAVLACAAAMTPGCARPAGTATAPMSMTSMGATSTAASVSTTSSAGDTSTVDPSQTTTPAQPTATDVATNPDTQGQVVAAGLNTAASSAAAGTSGAGSSAGASLLLVGGGLALDDASTEPQMTVGKGNLDQDCYTGVAHIQGPSRPNGLLWPEGTSPSVFADSMNAPSDTSGATMFVESSLTQYPATSPTATLTLSTPFAFDGMAEVIEKDTRSTSVALNDKAQTTVQTTTQDEMHRFWVAKNAITGAASAEVGCVGTGATAGSDGKWAKIKWADTSQTDGLSLLERFDNAGSQAKSFLPRIKGKLTAPAETMDGVLGQTGERLVQYVSSTASASAVAGATIVRQKTITHSFNDTNELTDASGNVKSSVNSLDEVRATAPLEITEYRDANEDPLEHVIASGTIMKTGHDASGNVTWFTTLAFTGVTFDLQNSMDVCVPVAGSVTMTTFPQEGGTALKQITITYSSTPDSAGGGKVDPVITVSGDDADGTQAQWIKLHVNERCDLRG